MSKDKSNSEWKQKLNVVCRLCLTDLDPPDTINIFKNDDNISLSLRIMACATLEVQENDELPKNICAECRHQLEKFYLFRKRSKNTDTKLRRHIRLMNAGKKSRLFEESDDEYEDDYEESIAFLKKWESKQKATIDAENIKKEHNTEVLRLQTVIKGLENDMKTLKSSVSKSIEEKLVQERTRIHKEVRQEYNSRLERVKQEMALTPKKMMKIEKDAVCPKPTVDDVTVVDKSQSRKPRKVDLTNILRNSNRLKIQKNMNKELESQSESGDESKQYIELPEYLDEDETLNDTDEYRDTLLSDSVDEDEQNSEKPVDNDKLLIDDIFESVKESIITETGIDLNTEEYNLSWKRKGENVIQITITTADNKQISVDVEDGNTNKPVISDNIELDENGELKIFQCKYCPQSFSRRFHLKRHATCHTNRNGFRCNYCEKWFPSKSSLERHHRVHTGEKPFKCEVCEKSFIQKEILKRHMVIHTGKRPFPCEKCDKSFTQKDVLRQHFQRYHTENPVLVKHQCSLCPKSFQHSSGLSRHLLTHVGKTFDCEYCQRKFSDKSAAKRHTVSIHAALIAKAKDE